MPVIRDLVFGRRSVRAFDVPWESALVDGVSATGKRVTPTQSMRVAAVYAAVRLLSESIASLPIDLIRREGNRRTVQDGPLAELLTQTPNPEQDAPDYYRTVMGWMLIEGNAYAYIERDARGTPVGLWPLPSTAVEIGRTPARQLFYNVKITTDVQVAGPVPESARVGPESILHYKAFGVGAYGLSPIRQIREAVATSLAAQEYMGRFYAQDASPGGVVQVPDELSDTQFRRLEKQWNERHQGVSRSHLLAILEGGATWQKTGLAPQDAAFVATQKWETVEVARAFGIPPHMIGDVERSTSWGSGVAEQGIGFVTYTLTPWITRLEWVARRGLLAALDPQLRLRWRVDALQRGDTKSRYEGYQIGRNWGWLSANDIRTFEDLDPIDAGDTYLQPLNMVPADTPTPERGVRRARSAAGRRRVTERFAALIADDDRRTAKLERAKVDKLVRAHLDARQPTDGFMEAVEALYAGTVSDAMTSRWRRTFALFAAAVATEAADDIGVDAPDLDRWVAAYVTSHVDFRTARSVAKLRDLATGEDAAALIRSQLDDWVERRPAMTARRESTQMSRAAARETWRAVGVRQMVWVTSGGCPICSDLDGRVVGIEEPFARRGDLMAGGDDQSDLRVGRDTFHPPLHDGCDCDIAAA